MKTLTTALACALSCLGIGAAFADNQTSGVSNVLTQSGLPFSVSVQQAGFSLPLGVHSGLTATYKGLWILIAGRIDGLHGFAPADNFPVGGQNTNIYVINPATGAVNYRSITDPSSGLSEAQIESLTVTSPEGFQEGNTLYLAGGYGQDSAAGTINTKPLFTAINLPGIVQWVTQPGNKNFSVVKNIQQISNPVFQVAGGKMYKLGNVIQLVFGQNFDGEMTNSSNGDYTQQVRQFQLKMVGGHITAEFLTPMPNYQEPNYRRADINVLPALLNKNNVLTYGALAYAGAFTTTGGIWTVPVIIDDSSVTMPDPNSLATFRQPMNQYVCATAGLYSRKYNSMFNIFFGGLSYGFITNGVFDDDPEIPFINQVTTIQMDASSNFSQYKMDGEYPVIPSTGSNPGNPLLFGTGAYFIPANIQQYQNGVINLDNIQQPTVIGYIVGGIASTVPNTSAPTDSFASTYIFTVTLTPTTSKTNHKNLIPLK